MKDFGNLAAEARKIAGRITRQAILYIEIPFDVYNTILETIHNALLKIARQLTML